MNTSALHNSKAGLKSRIIWARQQGTLLANVLWHRVLFVRKHICNHSQRVNRQASTVLPIMRATVWIPPSLSQPGLPPPMQMALLKRHCLYGSIHNPSARSEKAKSFSRRIFISEKITAEGVTMFNGRRLSYWKSGETRLKEATSGKIWIFPHMYTCHIFVCACVIILIMRKGGGASRRCPWGYLSSIEDWRQKDLAKQSILREFLALLYQKASTKQKKKSWV